VKSVVRSLDVLEVISDHQPITVGELTRLLDLPKSTVQRTLVTLHEAGWLRQTSDAVTSWEISPKILAIRPPALRDGELYAAARGPMSELRDATNETVHLVLPNEDDGVILIDRADCDQPVRSYSPLGYRSPYMTTATGKAIMAYLGADDVARILRAAPADQFDGSELSVATLSRDLARVRATGYSLNLLEHRPGVCAIGAPILDARQRPIASICISIPSMRFDKTKVDAWAALTVEAAARISQGTA
jgi:IclR family acetate operon transcriptional repressor